MKRSLTVMAFALAATTTTAAYAEKTYHIAWSHYTGWEPWGWIQETGLAKRHMKACNADVQIRLINDYIESVNLYTAGEFDGVAVTNMDALTIPAVGGRDTTAVIVGDFSNGNDAIVSKKAGSVKELKGENVKLVELSVSHYLLARALAKNGMSERDLKVTNTSDADIGSLFTSQDDASVVTWNPIVMTIRNQPGAKVLFDSSQIPGEIIDMLVMATETPECVKGAIAKAWFEAVTVILSDTSEGKKAREFLARQAGGSYEEFMAQLETTEMFGAAAAAGFVKSGKLKDTMEAVRTFSFDHGLFGNGAPDKDFVGIEFPDGSVLGSAQNVKLRFTAKYMEAAAR